MRELAELLHEKLCDDAPDCGRFISDRPVGERHRRWYWDRAVAIQRKLEPEIGAAKVKLAVEVIIGEVA